MTLKNGSNHPPLDKTGALHEIGKDQVDDVQLEKGMEERRAALQAYTARERVKRMYFSEEQDEEHLSVRSVSLLGLLPCRLKFLL